MTAIPPEGYKKYPWALGPMKLPCDFFFEGDDADRAASAARVWASRNKHHGIRVATRKEPGGVRIYFQQEN